MGKTVKVGIIGFGTVGAGAAVNLLKNHDVILERTNVDVKLVKIADKDITSDRGVKVPAELLTTSVDELIAESDIVVELIGGTTIAGVYALEKGGLRGAAMDAVLAAYEKTMKLKS